MLTSEAVARAVRGHFLVDAALNTLLVCNTLSIPVPVNTSINDAVQTTDEPTDTGKQQENATKPDEPTSTEGQQGNVTEPRLFKQLIDAARHVPVQLQVWWKPGFLVVYQFLLESGHRDNICAAREPSA